MAVKVETTETAKINIQGTDIGLESVYVRLRFLGDFDGKTMEVVFETFQNKEKYLEGTPVKTNLSGANFKSELDETQIQSIETAQEEAIKAFEQLGFKASIV